jgi:hypothetical protein
LVSLDEQLFDDRTMTRGDTISRGLWDQVPLAPIEGAMTFIRKHWLFISHFDEAKLAPDGSIVRLV